MKEETLSEKINKALLEASNGNSSLEALTENLLEEIHVSYDPIQVLKDMLNNNTEFFEAWQSAIASSFKGLIQYNQVLEDIPIIVFDERQVNEFSNQAAANFLNLFSGKVEIEENHENN